MVFILRVAICDDDPTVEQDLLRFLPDFFPFGLSVKGYSNGAALLHDLSNRLAAIDLLFLDIEMPYVNGVQAARIIREADDDLQIIFITSHQQYSLDCHSVQPFDFLLKPLSQDKLLPVTQKAVRQMNRLRGEQRLHIQTKQQSFYLPYPALLYLESRGKQIIAHTKNETHAYYGSFSKTASDLCAEGFIQIHRCIVVNPRHIDSIDYQTNTVHISGAVLPVSVRRRIAVKEAMSKRYSEILHL